MLDMLQEKFTDAGISVITIGNDNQVRVSTNYKIESNNTEVDGEVEALMFESFRPLLEKYQVSQEMFVKGYVLDENGIARLSTSADDETLGVQTSQKVGPAIADDIKNAAVIAVVLSLLGIFLYILLRFRNVSFSLGAVASLVHDTMFILGIYSLLYSIMPFSMEIDQSFIAAILTVIGYSVNDTVVIFDRVREYRNLYPKRGLKEVINDAVNSTLARTFSTSFSTLLVLLIIFIFGGETIRSFTFAMLVGVIIGTYSTLFIAVPIAYDYLVAKAKKQAKAVQAK